MAPSVRASVPHVSAHLTKRNVRKIANLLETFCLAHVADDFSIFRQRGQRSRSHWLVEISIEPTPIPRRPLLLLLTKSEVINTLQQHYHLANKYENIVR